MEEVERTNVVIAHLGQQAKFTSQQDLYAMEVDRENRNYYNCRGFGHLVRNCRNKGIEDRIGENRKLEYRNKNNGQRRMIEKNGQNNNLNREQDLILLD